MQVASLDQEACWTVTAGTAPAFALARMHCISLTQLLDALSATSHSDNMQDVACGKSISLSGLCEQDSNKGIGHHGHKAGDETWERELRVK